MKFSDEAPHLLANVRKLKCSLTYFIEPDYGLLDELLSLEVLTLPKRAVVRSKETVYQRNAALLDLLETEDECCKFLKALKQSGQQHVLNYITANGGQKHDAIATYLSVVTRGNNGKTDMHIAF